MNAPVWKVLLVDDDPLILDDLKASVDWRALGYSVVGTAYNGKRALEYVKKIHPHLVITDIVMPIMDGLTLINEIRSYAPETFILIITAYDEFEYAQKALQGGVADYILKTEVGTEPFSEKLRTLHSQIDRQQQRLRHSICVEMSTRFASASSDMEQGENLFAHNLEQYLSEAFYFCIATPKLLLYRHGAPRQTMRADNVYQRMLRYEALRLPGVTVAFLIRYEGFDILALRPTAPENRISIHSLGNLIATQTAALAGAEKAVVFYTRTCMRIDALRTAFFARFRVLEFYAAFPPAKHVFELSECSDAQMVRVRHTAPFPPLTLHDTQSAFSMFRGQLEWLFANCNYQGIDEFYKSFCDHYERMLPDAPVFEDKLNLSSCEELCAWFESSYLRLVEQSATSALAGYSRPIQRVIERIRRQYGNPNLSIGALAAMVCLSPNHLSNLFKRETGKTINDYLTEVRVEAAKYLLENTAFPIHEIAERVGYRLSQYFSQVYFKKARMNPRDLRRSMSEKGKKKE